MNRLLFLLISVLVVATFVAGSPIKEEDDPIVTLHHGGSIRGKSASLGLREKYYSFKGIPYALPPVGNLRFKSPVQHSGWQDIKNTTSHGNVCVGPNYIIPETAIGAEDCLFLNVYTPSLDSGKKYSVMFWIHGGSFTSGSGNSFVYGSEWLVKEETVVVTINYRLGLLGFFSTGDKHSPGNYGAKDIVEALRWVNKNIEKFGGDKDRVTIFGESAGGALTHYLVLSPMAKGLFHRAIAQSGTAIAPWSFQEFPRTEAFKIARKLNITATTTEGIMNELKKIEDVSEFARITPSLVTLEVPRGLVGFAYAPVVEPEEAEEERFLIEPPLTMIKKGIVNDVPFIIGHNNQESLYGIRELNIDTHIWEKWNNNSHYLVPSEWHIQPGSAAAEDIIHQVRKMYFNGKQIIDDKMEYITFNLDRTFGYNTYKAVQMHSAIQKQPVYYYIFSFDGIMNYIKKIFLVMNYEGAMHADELGYLWKMAYVPAPALPGSPSAVTKSRMTKMWTNFAKYGNPTPEVDGLITAEWPRVQEEQFYMDIDNELMAKKEPHAERMKMWKELDKKYN